LNWLSHRPFFRLAPFTDAPGRSCPSGLAFLRARREALPRTPIERTRIAPSLLTADERHWLNICQAESNEAGYRWSMLRRARG
jgi:hypothetical protein